MKQMLGAAACAAAMVGSLTSCGSRDDKAALPVYTGGSSPSASATEPPTTGTASATGPVALAAHSTYTYGGLSVEVNLPTDISTASRASLQLFSNFLQGVSRTIAENTYDPSVSGLASVDMVKYVRSFTVDASVAAIGSMKYTVSKVQTGKSGVAVINGCADQSKLVQVRKDGSHYIGPGVMKYPTMKLTANINPGGQGLQVTAFTISSGSCS